MKTLPRDSMQSIIPYLRTMGVSIAMVMAISVFSTDATAGPVFDKFIDWNDQIEPYVPNNIHSAPYAQDTQAMRACLKDKDGLGHCTAYCGDENVGMFCLLIHTRPSGEIDRAYTVSPQGQEVPYVEFDVKDRHNVLYVSPAAEAYAKKKAITAAKAPKITVRKPRTDTPAEKACDKYVDGVNDMFGMERARCRGKAQGL